MMSVALWGMLKCDTNALSMMPGNLRMLSVVVSGRSSDQARQSLSRLHPPLSQLAGCTLCWVFVSQGYAARWGRILMSCCSWLMPDITLKPPSSKSAPQVFPDHRCTPHLPSSSSHNSVIRARPTFFTYVFRCLILSRFSAIKGRGKEGEKKERKGERERGRERVKGGKEGGMEGREGSA